MKPKLAAFPKCFMDELCVHHTMTLFQWIDLAATLGVDGLEFYSGFLEDDEAFLSSQGLRSRNTISRCPCSAARRTSPSPIPRSCRRKSIAKSG